MAVDWDAPPDADTPEEMIEMHRRERIQEDLEAVRNEMLWNHFAGHFGRDGRLVIPIRYKQSDR